MSSAKRSLRSTKLIVTAIDISATYGRLLDAFKGLRSFFLVQSLAEQRFVLREIHTEDPTEALTGSEPVIHAHPAPQWEPIFEHDHDGAPLRLLNMPQHHFVTRFVPMCVLDLSAIPKQLAIAARRDPARQRELEEMYRWQRTITFPGSGADVFAYFDPENEDSRRFVSSMTSVVRRPMTNHFQLQDAITGEPIEERRGTALWAGEDVQRRCGEERDFYAKIGWSTEQRRWIGWKTIPREPRRRASSR